jgi:hypothetical protein
MSFLLLTRLLTLLVALLYSLLHVDYDWIAMRLDRGLAVIAEQGHSVIVTAGIIGIYVTSLASVAIAFFAIPRWRFGARALAWCFLLMGVSLLTKLVECWWLRYLGWYVQVPSYISAICFSLPPLILAAFLSRPFIASRLYVAPETSNQSLEPTAGRRDSQI